jgi:hypothetical protein
MFAVRSSNNAVILIERFAVRSSNNAVIPCEQYAVNQRCHPERKGPQAFFSLGVVSEGSAVAVVLAFLPVIPAGNLLCLRLAH